MVEDQDQVVDALLAEVDKAKSTLRLTSVVCLQADPLLVSVDGVGSVPALQQGITMAEGDAAWAIWAPPRKPIVIAGAEGGGAQGLFGSGVDQSGSNANAGGSGTSATGANAFAVGSSTDATGDNSTAEGQSSTADGAGAHSEGSSTYAGGFASHAEGQSTQANGDKSHSEGWFTRANGENSHAEGNATQADGLGAHAEGSSTSASGLQAHAEGNATTADGDYSHAQGVLAHTFRSAEHATAMSDDDSVKVIQHSEASIASVTAALNVGTTTGPIVVPVHDGHFDAKLTIFSDNMADRWDITFRGSNDATGFAGRDTGTVTIDASAGGSSPAYGSSTVTWTVTGTSSGDVEITPSASISNRYAHVELFELHANV